MGQEIIQSTIEMLVNFATDLLLPAMVCLFFATVTLRLLIYWTVKRNAWFVNEFEKRVDRFMSSDEGRGEVSFYIVAKKLLERTFYELFEIRAIMKRRRPDIIMPWSDRIFLIKQGAAFLVKDTLRQLRFLKHTEFQPKLLHVSKNVIQRNPCFTKVFGVVPGGVFNDILNLMPGIFIILGIFGTFLGIMKALPELSGIDLADVEQTKLVMDQFLLKTAFAMSTSLLGIVLSVLTSFFNTTFSPEKLFIQIVDRYENVLDVLWNRSDNNTLPEAVPDFDENRDPIEALAEESLERELAKGHKKVKKGEREHDSGQAA